MAWWNNDWDYRLRVTVNSEHVDSNLTDVPLWVRLRDGNFDFTKTTTSGGAEIRFVDHNNNQIPHEVTQWNTASGIGDIWVKFPTVNSTEDSYVWMYYGNTTASGMADVKGFTNNLEEDEFPGTTLSGIWTWTAGTGGSYTVSGSNLYITSGSGDPASDPTWVHQTVNTNEDFDIKCKVYAPDIDQNYEHAGIFARIDANNWAKIVRLYNSGVGGHIIESYHRESSNNYTLRTASYTGTTTYLRMRRINGAITCWYSDTGDDDDWTQYDHATSRLETDAAIEVGLLSSHTGGGTQFVAAFDWFRFMKRPYGSQVWTDYDLVYHLNDETLDGTVEQVVDSSPALNHGTSSGHPTPGYAGIVGDCILNDGSDYIQSVGFAGILDDDDRTTLLWFKPTVADQGTYSGMFSYGAGGGGANNSWFMQAASVAEDYYGFDLWGNLTTTWLAVDPTDGWRHWAAKWDGSAWKAYMDACLVMDRSATPSTDPSPYYIGQNYYDAISCKGYIDEVRVCKEALTDDEIKVQYLNMAEHSKIMEYDEPDYEGLYPQWLGTWGQRIKLTIDYTKIDEPLENFPVLVTLASGVGITSADVTAVFDEITVSGTGKQVAFTTWNGTQQCYAEIEDFDVGNEQAWYWVRVPYISNVQNTILYLYYDSAQPENTQYIGDMGEFAATMVWDDDFKIVCHMANSPTGSASDIKNSAGGWDGTSYNMNSGNLGTSSLGKYLTFDGTAEFIDFGDVFYTDGPASFEAIANVTSFTGGQPRLIVNKRNSVGTPNETALEWSFYFTDADTIGLVAWSTPINCGADGPTFQGTEYYVAGTTGPSSGDTITMYANDAVIGTCVRTTGSVNDTAAAWQIGSRSNNNSSRYFYGNIREVRISTIVRPAAWTKATYYTSWDNLISYGASEDTEVFRFQGTVLVQGSPAARKIYLYKRSTGELVREVTSNEADGLFEAGSPHWDYHFVVILPELGDGFEPISEDQIHPGN